MAVNTTKDNKQPAKDADNTADKVEVMQPGTPVSPVSGVEQGKDSESAPRAAHTLRVEQHVATVTDPNELVEPKKEEESDNGKSVYQIAKERGISVNEYYRQTGQHELIRKRIDPDTGELIDLDYEG